MKVLAIAQRELQSMLGGIVGWMVITSFAFLTGVWWMVTLSAYSEGSQQIIAAPYMGISISYVDNLLAPFFIVLSGFLLLAVPPITMRLFSVEMRQHTLELLLTSPVSTTEIVLGKFFGAVVFITLMLASTLYIPAFMLAWTDVDVMLLLCSYAALWLAACNIAAIGLLCSAMTEHQVLALVLTVGIALAMLIAPSVSNDPTGILAELPWTAHMDNLLHGLISLYDLGYFLVIILVPLLATHQRLETRRW